MLEYRMRPALVALFVGVWIGSTVRSQQSRPHPAPSGETSRDVMEELAEAFAELEDALVRSDTAVAAASADSIVQTGAGLDAWPLLPSEGRARECVETVIEKARLVGAATRRADLPTAGLATRELRMACISCHVWSREDRGRVRQFPTTGNTVFGEITLLNREGKARGRVEDVVVFLDYVAEFERSRYPVSPPRVSQRDRQFQPRVLAVVQGDAVEFPNDDKIFHNVFSLSKTRPFDLGVYGKGEVRRVEFSETGLVRLFCNIHSDMTSAILVLQNPFFAVVDKDGRFTITGVSDGDYTLRTWHSLGGGAQAIKLSGGVPTRVDMTVTETRPAAAHLNKFGKPYKTKY